MKLKPQMTPDDLSLITFSTQIISLHDVLFADYLIQYNNRVYVRGHKYVLGPTRLINESEKGPKHIYAQEHKLYYYYYHFGGH